MSRNVVAIDISSGAVSAVVVKNRIKGTWIEDHVRIPLDGQKNFDDELSRALKTVAGRMDFSGAVCVASLPVESISFRSIEVPFKEKKKIRQILPYELETTLPIAPEDIVADFCMLNSEETGPAGKILAAAVERHRLESMLTLLKSHGIEPDVFTSSGFAMARCLNRFSENGGCRLLLQVDEGRTTLVLNHLNQVVLVRSFSQPVSSETGYHTIMTRIRQTLSALEESTGRPYEIGDIGLSGVEAGEAGFRKTIEKELGAPATVLDLSKDSGPVVLKPADKEWRALEMDACLALALAEIWGTEILNFRQGRFAVQQAWVEHKKEIVASGVLAVLVAVLFFVNVMIDYTATKRRADDVQAEIVAIFRSTFPQITKIVDPLHQMRLEVEAVKKADLFPNPEERSLDTIDILYDISKLIGNNIKVTLNSIIIGSDSILLSGDTDTFNAVDDMKNGLEKAESFKSVSISSANMDKSGAKVRFKLKITL